MQTYQNYYSAKYSVAQSDLSTPHTGICSGMQAYTTHTYLDEQTMILKCRRKSDIALCACITRTVPLNYLYN